MPQAPLTGTYFVSELAWLEGHAKTDEHQTYRCAKTGTRIRMRVLHRCRPLSAQPDDPYLEEHLWAKGSGVTDGIMLSFITMWCPDCGTCDRHPSVRTSELVCVPI